MCWARATWVTIMTKIDVARYRETLVSFGQRRVIHTMNLRQDLVMSTASRSSMAN